MRQDKTVAQILLIFSVNNFALAAPAIVQHRHRDETEAALEKRDSEGSDDEASDGLVLNRWPELASDSDVSRYLSNSGSSSRHLPESTDFGSSRNLLAPKVAGRFAARVAARVVVP